MRKKILIAALALCLPVAVCQAEEFYLCHGGDGTLPQSGICAYVFDEDDFNSAGTWAGADTTGDGTIGWGDTLLALDDGGDFTIPLAAPLAADKFTFKAAIGEQPTIAIASAANALSFPNAGKSEIIIGPGFTFSNWGDSYKAIYFVNPMGPLTITGDDFTKSDATSASTDAIRIFYQNTSADLDDVEVTDNDFNLNSVTSAMVVNITTSSGPYRVKNLNYHHNRGTIVNYGLRFLNSTGATWTLPQGLIPCNVKYDDNHFVKTYSSAIATVAGIAECGGTSSMSRNIVDACGDSSTAFMNCFQLHYTNGADIDDNTLLLVDTSDCDGAGIILDRTASSDSYLSSGNNVRRNTISAIAACGGKCISVFKGANNRLESNICLGSTGKGYRVANDESTGNVAIGNTAINCDTCFSQSDADNVGNTVTWVNGACISPTTKGFEVLNNSTAAESTNLVYNAPANDIALDPTDLTIDPKFDTQGRPAPDSPVINAGTDVGLPYWGSAPEIGAYEFTIQPVNVNGTAYKMPIWRLGVQ